MQGWANDPQKYEYIAWEMQMIQKPFEAGSKKRVTYWKYPFVFAER